MDCFVASLLAMTEEGVVAALRIKKAGLSPPFLENRSPEIGYPGGTERPTRA